MTMVIKRASHCIRCGRAFDGDTVIKVCDRALCTDCNKLVTREYNDRYRKNHERAIRLNDSDDIETRKKKIQAQTYGARLAEHSDWPRIEE